MDFRILGPLEVERDGRPLTLGAAKPQALLALLLLHAGEVVSSDRLIDGLWGEEAPATAQKALQVYVSQLRKALGPECPPHPAAGVRRSAGPAGPARLRGDAGARPARPRQR